MFVIGVDDGRGPVIGPLVIAGVMINCEDEENFLKEISKQDSSY